MQRVVIRCVLNDGEASEGIYPKSRGVNAHKQLMREAR